MAAPFIQNSFAAGELAPHLYGRTDLEKYRSGAAMMRNFFVDYRGGASTRPGTQFIGLARDQTAAPRLMRFQFNTSQTYILVMDAGGKMRLITNGGFVLETAIAITAGTNTNPLTLTIPGHTYSVGDDVYLSGVTGLTRPNGVSGVNGRTLRVSAVAGNVVTFVDQLSGATTAATWSAYVSGGTAARVYTVAIPWAAADLFALNFTQSADVLTVTHPSYPAYDVKRLGATNWTITAVGFGASIAAPASITATPVAGSGGSSVSMNFVYAVTAVGADNEESPVTTTASCTNVVLNQNSGTANNLSWSPVANASSYRVYKITPAYNGTQISAPYFWGFIGQTTGTAFVDANIAPDFNTVPPTHQNPFGTGPLLPPVTINAGGYGFISPIATISDPTGSGGSITLGIDTNGTVVTATLAAAGTGYSSPQVAVSDSVTALGTGLTLAFSGTWVSNGAGNYVPGPGSITISAAGAGYHTGYATATPTTGVVSSGVVIVKTVSGVCSVVDVLTAPVSSNNAAGLTFTITDALPGTHGLNNGALVSVSSQSTASPAVTAYFEQRKVFAGPGNAPDTFYASRPGLYGNFDTSLPSQDDDAITGTIVAQEVNAITSLTAMPSGLIALTSNGAFLISGGSPGAAFTPATAVAQAQAFSGAAALPPLRINYDLLYVQSRGSAVRDLSYNFYVNVYTGRDISALSSHLFEGRSIVQWAYAEEPYYLAWAVRDDGVMLSLTYLQEQEIYGWAWHDTQGLFVSVDVIAEGKTDTAYVAVQRYIAGQFVYTIERVQSRYFSANPPRNQPSSPEAAWCVDAGVQFPLTYPAATLSLVAANTLIETLTAPAVIEGGSGYTAPTLLIEDPTGTGAVITLAVAAGVITGATLVSGGANYTAPTFTVVDTTGRGAVINATISTQMTFQASSPVFSPGNLGDVLRVAGGIGTVAQVISNGQILVNMTTPLAAVLSNTIGTLPVMPPIASGGWSLTTPQTVVGGLDHLTGATVAVVADGSVLDPLTVSDGCITLPGAASSILAGQGFSAQLMTLRLDAGTPTVASRRKTIPALTVRSLDTRGLAVGRTFDTLVPVKEREDEQFGQPIRFSGGGGQLAPFFTDAPVGQRPLTYPDRRIVLDGQYDVDGQVCIMQSYPMPATILADIVEVSLGDTPSP